MNCPQCNYMLKGLPSPYACPECGFRYDEDTHVWTWSRKLSRNDLLIFIAVLTLSFIFAASRMLEFLGRYASVTRINVLLSIFWLLLTITGAFIMWRVHRYPPLTVIAPDGITHRSLLSRHRRIPWHEIAEITLERGRRDQDAQLALKSGNNRVIRSTLADGAHARSFVEAAQRRLASHQELPA